MEDIYLKREKDKIKELIKDYSSKGYEVISNPRLSDLPDFLKQFNYLPDLIVKSANENLIIEVKSTESISSAKNLVQFSELIEKQKGWEFLFVLTNPKIQREEINEEITITPENIIKAYRKLEHLLSDKTYNFNDVATLYLWSIIEAVLRFGLTLAETGSEVKGKSVKSLLRDSMVYGVISKKDYEVFNSLVLKRNAISHGHIEEQITSHEIEDSLSLIKRIHNEIIRQNFDQEEDNYIAYLRSLDKKDLETEIDNIICEITHELMDEDAVNSEIANTNTFAWDCDDYSIEEIEILETECIVTLYFHATGEIDDDKPFHGNTLSGRAEAVIEEDENVYFQNVTASLDLDDLYYE